ncbi:MAG: SagB/ThcOx family dehydrogenase [Lentisphaerae bacterium]|nr:SagB/ThcOx family dehydrogenase [Lentisphaerota bacterium]
MIQLPQPDLSGTVSLERAIAGRRSIRNFTKRKITASELSLLLWAAQGITEPIGGGRSAPSAGATFPLNTYLFTGDGVFQYENRQHALRKLSDKDMRSALSAVALHQQCVLSAPVSFLFTAIAERTTSRYGDRGVMYIHMEAGHAAQNLHLQAVALGLGSVPVGAFDEKEVAGLLELDSSETPLYIVPVGEAEI